MTRVAGALTNSGEVLKLVNNLMKVPQLQRTMVEMSRGGPTARGLEGRAGGQGAAQGGPASARGCQAGAGLLVPRGAGLLAWVVCSRAAVCVRVCLLPGVVVVAQR